MKYVNYDNNTGAILSFYDNGIHKVIPKPSFEISQEEWIACNERNFKVDPDKRKLVEVFDTKAQILFKAKEAKKDVIREDFRIDESGYVTVLDIEWHGGYESGARLDSARRLSLETGQAMVQFSDTRNVTHDLLLEDALSVVIAIGYDFQVKFRNKQLKLVAISEAKDLSEVEGITYQ